MKPELSKVDTEWMNQWMDGLMDGWMTDSWMDGTPSSWGFPLQDNQTRILG